MENLQERHAELMAVRARVGHLKALVKSPGWDLLAKLIAAQAASRIEPRMRQVISTHEDALLMNLNLGIILGLEQALKLPETVIEQTTLDYQSQLEEYNALASNASGTA